MDTATIAFEAREDRIGFLKNRADAVAQAQAALRAAERDRRIQAVIEVRAKAAGLSGALDKAEIAAALGISRPTLDTWITMVEVTPDEIAEVVKAERSRERFLQRHAEKLRAGLPIR